MRGDVLMKANKPQIVAASVTALVHVAVLLLLLLMTIDRPAANREGGVEVMLGNFELAGGDMPGSEATGTELLPPADEAETGRQPLLTQADEPSAAIDEDARPEDEERQTPPQKTKEQLQAEHERKVAEEADRLMGSAFAKGSQMTGSGGRAAAAAGRPPVQRAVPTVRLRALPRRVRGDTVRTALPAVRSDVARCRLLPMMSRRKALSSSTSGSPHRAKWCAHRSIMPPTRRAPRCVQRPRMPRAGPSSTQCRGLTHSVALLPTSLISADAFLPQGVAILPALHYICFHKPQHCMTIALASGADVIYIRC